MKIHRLAPALLAVVIAFMATSMAHAARGAYSLTWSAADPAVNSAPYLPTYPKLTPGQLTPPLWNPAPSGGTGRAADPLPDAVYGDPNDAVQSLTPEDMALGQIVPFELKLKVSGSTAPENGTIVFTPYFNTKTTNGGDFGFDPAYGIYSAFVDTADSAAVNGSTAKVSSYSWSILNAGTGNEKIQGAITVSGLQDGDTVIVEVWVVLKSTIAAGVTGNVQTGLVSAETVDIPPGNISIGNQTVPLLQVGKFFSAEADVSVTKSDSPDPVQAGNQLTYTIVVTNNSTTTVANSVVVTDTLDANTTFVSASGAPYTVTGNTITFTVGALNQNNYSLPNTATLQVVVTVGVSAPDNDTSTDPEPGSASPPALFDINNVVTATALTSDPDTTNNTYYQPTNVLSALAEIQLEKSGVVNAGQDGVAQAGETITYTFTVTNTGNVTLTNVTVIDPKVAVVGGPIILAPGASDSTTFTGSYTLTQEDIDAGQVGNTATTYGTPPVGDPVTDDGSTVTYITQVPSIQLEKSGVVNAGGDGVAQVGETITYTFTVTNTGNVTLTNVTVTDPKVTVIGGPITLAPGASDSTTFAGTYTLTQADIDAGQVPNTATAYGTPSTGTEVTDDGSTVNYLATPECFSETAWAAEDQPGQTRFVPAPGDWATYIVYERGTGTAEEPKSFPLYAGQTHLSGWLYVYDVDNTLYVRYVTLDDDSDPPYKPGYCGSWSGLTEYHLEVVGTFAGFNPVRTYNKKKNQYGGPIPGAFRYKASYEEITPDTGWIEADIAGFSNDIYIAAHGVMWWCGYPCAE